MIQPMLTLLTKQSGLLLQHMAIYGELLNMHVQEGLQSFQRRLVLIVMAATCAISAVVFLGVAALISAAIPLQTMPAPLMLIAVPAGLLCISAICWISARRQSLNWNFDLLRQQAALDMNLINECLEN